MTASSRLHSHAGHRLRGLIPANAPGAVDIGIKPRLLLAAIAGGLMPAVRAASTPAMVALGAE